MTDVDFSVLLDDKQTGALTDLFLAHLGLDADTLSYRRLKSTVIFAAKLFDDIKSAYAAVAKTEGADAAEVERDVVAAIKSLPAPAHELFNAKYCPQAEIGFMPQFTDPNDTVAFLGKTFLYILESNYK